MNSITFTVIFLLLPFVYSKEKVRGVREDQQQLITITGAKEYLRGRRLWQNNNVLTNELGLCQGDCNSDSDCQGNLVCFTRLDNSIDTVPGCLGEGIPGDDYCTHRPWSNYLMYKWNADYPNEPLRLGFCQGDCDDDDDCQNGMVCYKRGCFDPIPGCEGLGARAKDYCIPDPEVCDKWVTVVQNKIEIPDEPGYDGKFFGSYNAPSVNTQGYVVFRARSTGDHEPSTGIFVVDRYGDYNGVILQARRRSQVPMPNNLDTDFVEFPSFPRISRNEYNIAFRGNHGPVCQYAVVDPTSDGFYNCDDAPIDDVDSTRTGNTGIYASLNPREDEDDNIDTSVNLFTAMAKLGSVPDLNDTYSESFQVPGLKDVDGNDLKGVVFDVFPGAPSIDDSGLIATKGNYNKLGVPQTGVFYRMVIEAVSGVILRKMHLVANSETDIPPPISGTRTKTCADSFGSPTTKFESTAPPSVAAGNVVFLALDNEEKPMCGGIFEASMDFSDKPELTPLVDLETEVPGTGQLFARIGDALSYDGSAVAFWGAWGDEERSITLCCPKTGNKDRRDFCLRRGNYTTTVDGVIKGDEDSICENVPEECKINTKHLIHDGCYQEKTVPVNQGFFVFNKVDKTIKTIATLTADDMNDMVFWTYSGKPPGAGSDDHGHHGERKLNGSSDAAEPPRFRSSATAALSQYNQVVYKQKKDGAVGVWRWDGTSSEALVEVGDNCTDLDEYHGLGLVESVAIERDGYRGPYVAIAASCAEEEEGDEHSDEGDWGGIFLRSICPGVPPPPVIDCD